MQRTVIETAARTKLILDSLDAWLLAADGRIINKRNRALFTIVVQRQSLVTNLDRAMAILGLDRRGKSVTDLGTYIAGKYGPGAMPAPLPQPAAAEDEETEE
jgi:hypothetical protein